MGKQFCAASYRSLSGLPWLVSYVIEMLQGYVISCVAVGVTDGDCSVVTLSEIDVLVGLRRSVYYHVCPALHCMAIRGEFRDVETRILTNVM